MIFALICNALRIRLGSLDRCHRAVSILVITLSGLAIFSGCSPDYPTDNESSSVQVSALNFDHLDFLGENVTHAGETLRLIHIYSESPDYSWVSDHDEGAAALDDAARAAVLYLTRYAYSGDANALEKGRQLLRFVMYMQTPEGLFYNFVWDNSLRINVDHENSRADEFGWWASRAVWALGTGALILKDIDPDFSLSVANRIRLTYPYLDMMLERYDQFEFSGGDRVPRWLVSGSASDATSELLLGLTALNKAFPNSDLGRRIDLFADGISQMQKGSMASFPYGAHISFSGIWHGWGNSQTQALSESGHIQSAVIEAENYFPRLLVDGWNISFLVTDPASTKEFSQIAYEVRCVSVGLVKLYEATRDQRYAIMAGLASSWFFGNNVANAKMYDSSSGRGFDGILSPVQTNRNAGAESTIEALYSILEVENTPVAKIWMKAVAGEVQEITKHNRLYRFRVFTRVEDGLDIQIALVMNLTDEILLVLEGEELINFLGT